MRLILILCFLFTLSYAYCQKIDNTASFREIQGEKYFRVNYDNDYFTAQDRDYTQGYSLELVLPIFLKNPINKLFMGHDDGERTAGIAFEHIGFTPNHYGRLEVQIGDRPFASVALLKSFSISTNQEYKQRLASHLSFGVMGPAAKGKEMQTGIHNLTGDRTPYGWINQINNQIVLNYGIDYEKELIRLSNYFSLNANASAKIGNLFTNATVGLNTVFGLINNHYDNTNSKNFRLYAYIQPLVTVVAYDGTLQGGIFGKESIYTIPASDINRVVGQVNYGIVFQLKSVYLEYSRANITNEIKTLGQSAWGGVKIGFRL